MNCKKCNSFNQDGTKFCGNCGEMLEVEQEVIQNFDNNTSNNIAQNMSEVPEYKPASAIAAIVFSLLCCGGILGAIFAILGLIEGNKVKTFVQSGDIESAKISLEQAKKWNKISWIIIAVISVIIFVYFAAVIGLAIYSEL